MMGKLYVGSRMTSFTGICVFWMEDFLFFLYRIELSTKEDEAKDESFNFIRTCVYTFVEN